MGTTRWFPPTMALLVCLMLLPPIGAAAIPTDTNEGVRVAASFDAGEQELPEGITIDKRGDIYVTMGYPGFWAPGDGFVKKIDKNGNKTTLAFFEDGQGPAGIVVSPGGDLYFARPNPGSPENGVYRLNDDGSTERLPGSEHIVLANGLALNAYGDLFVSDSVLGMVWRIPRGGAAPAEPWFADPLLEPCTPGDVGANGVALWKDSLYVANTAKGLLVRIAILQDGSAGPAEVVAGDPLGGCTPFVGLWSIDGIALDVHGSVYACLVIANKLVRIDPNDGSIEVLLTEADGLHNPASIAFGTGNGDRRSVFISNYAVIPIGGPSLGPAVLTFDVGVPGLPLP